MKLNEIIKLEPINITAIIILLIIVFLFKSQWMDFLEGLRERPFKVVMDSAGIAFDFEVPLIPQDQVRGFSNPTEIESHTLENWADRLEGIHGIEEFKKAGFSQLYHDISNLGAEEIAVLNYEVNNPAINYFKDSAMLKYLSIAADKFKYLVFYENEQFVAFIKIEKVIKGLAAGEYNFKNFGQKLIHNDWQQFPGIIQKNKTISQIPTIQELYNQLEQQGLKEVALINDGKLKAILNYKTISNALYQQLQP